MKKAAHHAKASNLVALGANPIKPKTTVGSLGHPAPVGVSAVHHYKAFSKKQLIQRTSKNYPHQKSELGELVKKIQCVHKYRSGIDQVGIYFFELFLKKRTEKIKMRGIVYFDVF